MRNPLPWSNNGEERTLHITVTGSMHRTPAQLMSPMIINWMTSTMTQNYKLSADMLEASLGAEHNTKTTSSAGVLELVSNTQGIVSYDL